GGSRIAPVRPAAGDRLDGDMSQSRRDPRRQCVKVCFLPGIPRPGKSEASPPPPLPDSVARSLQRHFYSFSPPRLNVRRLESGPYGRWLTTGLLGLIGE